MSRKYAVGFDGSLISSDIIPEEWEVVELSKQAVAKVIAEIDWEESDPLLEHTINEDVMCVCEVIPLHTVSTNTRDKVAQHMIDTIDLAA